MIEIFPVLFIAIVAVGAYVGARSYANGPRNRGARIDLMRIKAQQAWLKARVLRARRESWDIEMRSHLEDQLAATELELATTKVSSAAANASEQATR